MRIRRFCCVRFVGFSLALRPVLWYTFFLYEH